MSHDEDLDVSEMIVKIELPRLHSDLPKATVRNQDGSFMEKIDVTSMLLNIMRGRMDAYFELKMKENKILSLKPVPDQRWEGKSELFIN